MSDAESECGSYQEMAFPSACLELLEETIGADRMELPFAHCQLIEEVIIPYLSSAAYSGPTLSQALQAMAQAHADDADGEDPPLPLDCEPTLINEAAWYLLCSLQPFATADPLTVELGQCDWAGAYDAFESLLYPYAHSTPTRDGESLYLPPVGVAVGI